MGEYIQEIRPDWIVQHDDDEFITFDDKGYMQTGLVKAIQELKQENDILKQELCAKDNTYSWCN